MKRLASKAPSSVRKKPSGKSRGLLKRPATKRKIVEKKRFLAVSCKPIEELTPKDFLFFEVPRGRNGFCMLRGCKSPNKGYMFEHVEFNRFSDSETKIPQSAKRKKVPTSEWLSEFFWDPAKRQLKADATDLPERARGAAYRIEDNGGMPFVCYLRDDEVSVFRVPKDGYILDDDWPDQFEAQRLLYTEEVDTFTNVIKAWPGIDAACDCHGNSVLVHIPPSSKGKSVTASIISESTRLHISCVNLAGEEVLSDKFNLDVHVSTLMHKVQESLCCAFVKCFGPNGENILHDQPLKQYEQLTLRDVTQSYVCISGSEMFSFDMSEEVTAYYSIMGNSRVPYPVALTATSALFMLDYVQVPRKELASEDWEGKVGENGEENWGDAYGAFYAKMKVLTITPFANRKELCCLR